MEELVRCIVFFKNVFFLELNVIFNLLEMFYIICNVEISVGYVFCYGECNYDECNSFFQDFIMVKYCEELEKRFNLIMIYLQ